MDFPSVLLRQLSIRLWTAKSFLIRLLKVLEPLLTVSCVSAGKQKQRKNDLLLDLQQRGHQRTSSQSGVLQSASPPSAPAVLRLSVTKHGFC